MSERAPGPKALKIWKKVKTYFFKALFLCVRVYKLVRVCPPWRSEDNLKKLVLSPSMGVPIVKVLSLDLATASLMVSHLISPTSRLLR